MLAFTPPRPRPPRLLPTHIQLLALALALSLLAQPSCAQYHYFSFEYNLTDISPLLKWGIPRVHPAWDTNFTNLYISSAAPFTPWTSPSNYTGLVGWGDSYHIVQPPQDPAAQRPRLDVIAEATEVRIRGSQKPDTASSVTELEYSVDKSAWDNSSDTKAPAQAPGTLLSLDLNSFKWGMRTIRMMPMDPARTYQVDGVTIRAQMLSNAYVPGEQLQDEAHARSSWEQVPVVNEAFVVNQAPNPRFIVTNSESSRWRPENRRTAVNCELAFWGCRMAV